MTLRFYDDADEFIIQFSGDDRLIADYLSEEVLQAQPDDRREFLLHVSVLDSMSAELVMILTNEPNAQLVLEDLERDSMFLVPLDGGRQSFRFHHLFRDMLRFKLRGRTARSGGSPAGPCGRVRHLERGDVSTALDYFLRAEPRHDALNVIMARGSEVFEKGEMATVIRWISEVPEAARVDRHEVSLLLGILMGVEGLVAGAEDILGRLAADPGSSEGERVCAQVFLASLVQWRPRPEVSLGMATRALGRSNKWATPSIPAILNLSHPTSLETMSVLSAWRAHFQAGRPPPGSGLAQTGTRDASGGTYPIWKVSGLGSLGLLEIWRGNTERAIALSDEALATAREVGLLAHPCTAEAYLTSALVALEQGEPGRARFALHEGILRSEANRRSQLARFGRPRACGTPPGGGRQARASDSDRSLPRSDLGHPRRQLLLIASLRFTVACYVWADLANEPSTR